MGGTGNSSRGGTGPATGGESKGTTPATEREAGEKRERGEGKAKGPELFKSPETLAQAAKEKERKQELKSMTPEARAEHFAQGKMFDRMNKKEWNKSEKQVGHDKTHQLWHGKGGKYEKLKAQWAKGGAKAWAKANPKQAAIIRDKARREEQWRVRKKTGALF